MKLSSKSSRKRSAFLKKSVALIKGETSTDKRFLVIGMNGAALRKKLDELANEEGGKQ